MTIRGDRLIPSTYRILPPAPFADLDAYVRAGGRRGLRRTLGLGADGVIAEIERSRLRGRGGAGFPTAAKWRQVRAAAGGRDDRCFVVANGAEGEPGSYKDRLVTERSPYAVIEGTLIALHAVGAQAGFIAVRQRGTLVTRLTDALEEVRSDGWEGADALSIEPGPQDYLFGEETAVLEVLEGKPPLPRIVRPHEAGLFAGLRSANPTVVDNVETLAHVSAVLAGGADRFLQCGTDASPGTALFTVLGDVRRPGVWELPLGTPMRELIVDLAGAGDILAILGGASSALATADDLDTPLEFDAMRDAGLELGSRGFVVVDGSRCIVQVLATFARFLAIESCGQCMGCRIGTDTIADRLARIDRGRGRPSDVEQIEARARWLTDGARCHLPRGAEQLIAAALDRFRPEITDHLGRRCSSSRPLRTPLIEHVDPGTGSFVLDPTYDADIPAHGRRRGMPR